MHTLALLGNGFHVCAGNLTFHPNVQILSSRMLASEHWTDLILLFEKNKNNSHCK